MAAHCNSDDLYNVFNSRRYVEIMQKFDSIFDYHGGVDHPDLITDCHALLVEIDNEIVTIHNFICDNYLRLESPELYSLVHHPIDFARLVKEIGNDNPPTLVTNLKGVGLPSEISMVFSNWRLEKAIEACERSLALDSAKKKVLEYLESRIEYVAPNLCAVVGKALAVKLMTAAGGLPSLAKMYTDDVQRLGTKRYRCSKGYIEESEIIESTPSSLWMQACDMVAEKCRLAASADLTGEYQTGLLGKSYRVEIHKKVEKWQRYMNEMAEIHELLFKI